MIKLSFCINQDNDLVVIYKDDNSNYIREFTYLNANVMRVSKIHLNLRYCSDPLKEIEEYELSFNEKIKKQLECIVKFYFKRTKRIEEKKYVPSNLWRSGSPIPTDKQAMNFYKTFLKLLYKKHKNLLEQLDLDEYYEMIKSL